MKKDLLITFAAGDSYVNNLDCELFLQSLKKFSSFEKLCIVKDVTEETRKNLKRYFDYVVDPVHPVNVLVNDRFMSYYEWLAPRARDYEYVMQFDFRDVIVQKNPFEFMRNQPDYDLFLVSEGMTVGESSFNTWWAENVRRTLSQHKYDYRQNQVLNSGTFGGKMDAVMQLCLMIFSNTNRISQAVVADQSILTWLYPQMAMNPLVKICHPQDSDFCATGEGIKYGHVKVKYDASYTVRNLEDTPYYIFHQWDRTPVADNIRNKHKNTLTFTI